MMMMVVVDDDGIDEGGAADVAADETGRAHMIDPLAQVLGKIF